MNARLVVAINICVGSWLRRKVGDYNRTLSLDRRAWCEYYKRFVMTAGLGLQQRVVITSEMIVTTRESFVLRRGCV